MSSCAMTWRSSCRTTVIRPAWPPTPCEALSRYGAGICSKIKLACQYCRVVLFCDKALEAHRKIIKDAMEIGIYACLLPPYADWEILTMVSYYPRM